MGLKVLHAGCGRAPLPDWLKVEGVEEIRLDIDKAVNPDICCSMTRIEADDECVDLVYSCHSIEHMTACEGQKALREFYRVLKGDGVCIIECPDIQKAAEAVAQNDPERPMYRLLSGQNITATDMLYGYSALTATNPYQCHRFGYTTTSLKAAMEFAGFVNVGVQTTNVEAAWNLVGNGRRP